MYDDIRFRDRVCSHQDRLDPEAGIWHWDYGPAVMTMLALGAAVCSEFFPHKMDGGVQDIVTAGFAIARNIICAVGYTEPLGFDWRECVQVLLMTERESDALDRLLS
jgi:hypothetical protein